MRALSRSYGERSVPRHERNYSALAYRVALHELRQRRGRPNSEASASPALKAPKRTLVARLPATDMNWTFFLRASICSDINLNGSPYTPSCIKRSQDISRINPVAVLVEKDIVCSQRSTLRPGFQNRQHVSNFDQTPNDASVRFATMTF